MLYFLKKIFSVNRNTIFFLDLDYEVEVSSSATQLAMSRFKAESGRRLDTRFLLPTLPVTCSREAIMENIFQFFNRFNNKVFKNTKIKNDKNSLYLCDVIVFFQGFFNNLIHLACI